MAQKVGLDGFFADVLPQGKVEIVKKMQAEGKFVGMAGDDINDAPALHKRTWELPWALEQT